MKLIFHIGAGKTGSSSIQKTLSGAENQLFENGICYVGLMFDRNVQKIYPWQDSSKIEEFHALPQEKTQEELLNLLQKTTREFESKNIHTLIWSNESFLGRMHKTLPILKEFEKNGHEVQIVAYVRRHDAWARSSYIQWGLKHKTYAGELKTFSEWIKNRIPSFSDGIKEVITIFPDNFLVRNMDKVVNKDVVGDFLSICGFTDYYLKHIRDNESPTNEELFFRILFNQHFTGQVLPKRFDRQIGQSISSKYVTPLEYMSNFLPSSEDIRDVEKKTQNDKMMLNEILMTQGQSPIDESPLSEKNYILDNESLVMALSSMVIDQSFKIEQLVQRVNELKIKID